MNEPANNPTPTNQGLANQPPPANQPAEPENPFKDIDKDLLPDDTRKAIEKAEQQFATLANQAKQSSTFQSEADRLRQQLEQTQNHLKTTQNQQNQQPQPKEKDIEGKVEAYYIEQGIEQDKAKAMAKMQAPLFEMVKQEAIQQVHNSYAPLVGQTLENTARDAFLEAQQSDSLGIFQDQEISQMVWDRAEAMTQEGRPVNPQVLTSLAKIFYMNRAEETGSFPDLNQHNQQHQLHINANQPPQGFSNPPAPAPPRMTASPAPQPRMNLQTRHTFPGAGNFARRPTQNGNSNQNAPTMTPDEVAAMETTVANWPVKPKAFRGGK